MCVTSRIELFNQMLLLIMQELLRNMPYRTDLDPARIADGMQVDVTAERRALGAGLPPGSESFGFGPLPNGDGFYALYAATLDFLEREGLIVRAVPAAGVARHAPGAQAALTLKGLSALRWPLPSPLASRDQGGATSEGGVPALLAG